MQHIIGIAALALIGGSKNAIKDYDRLRRLSIPPSTLATATLPVAIGQNFENLFSQNIIPELKTRLRILYRVARHIPHTGDGTLFFNGTVGLIELKNHSKPLPITDRKRFFDSIMINYKNINWGLMVTSKCSIPHFAPRGYSVIGKLKVENKIIPIGFVCDYNAQGIHSLETIIKSLAIGEIPENSPSWTPQELLDKGEMSDCLKLKWGTGSSENFAPPVGVVF